MKNLQAIVILATIFGTGFLAGLELRGTTQVSHLTVAIATLEGLILLPAWLMLYTSNPTRPTNRKQKDRNVRS